MPLSEHVLADYRTIRLSLKAYPTQFLRPALLTPKALRPCARVGDLDDGSFVRCAGVVLVRQRPGEGKAIFITLSDETGVCNVLVWARLFEKFRKEVMGARLLLAEGRMQKSPENVVHLMAERLVDRSADLRMLSGETSGAGHARPAPSRAMSASCRHPATFIKIARCPLTIKIGDPLFIGRDRKTPQRQLFHRQNNDGYPMPELEHGALA